MKCIKIEATKLNMQRAAQFGVTDAAKDTVVVRRVDDDTAFDLVHRGDWQYAPSFRVEGCGAQVGAEEMTDKINQLHDEKWDAIKKMGHISRELHRLSNAFFQTGNVMLAEDLNAMGSDLHKAVDTITGADAQMANISVQRSEQATSNMIRAALGVVGRVHTEDKPDE